MWPQELTDALTLVAADKDALLAAVADDETAATELAQAQAVKTQTETARAEAVTKLQADGEAFITLFRQTYGIGPQEPAPFNFHRVQLKPQTRFHDEQPSSQGQRVSSGVPKDFELSAPIDTVARKIAESLSGSGEPVQGEIFDFIKELIKELLPKILGCFMTPARAAAALRQPTLGMQLRLNRAIRQQGGVDSATTSTVASAFWSTARALPAAQLRALFS